MEIGRRAWGVFLVSWSLAGCAPSLSAPEEATRIQGEVRADDAGSGPIRIVVHERCSPFLGIFEKCPGKRLGEAKIAAPGRFLIEVDTTTSELTLFAFRDGPYLDRVCGEVHVATNGIARGVSLGLLGGTCPPAPPIP